MNTDEHRLVMPPVTRASSPCQEARTGARLQALFSICVFLCSSVALLLSGCASAVEKGHNTALDSVDLVAMTDDMAMKIVADPEVQEEIARRGKLITVVQPVENRMRGEILPRGAADAFTARLRVNLARHAPDRFTWVMNRDAFYALRARERDLDLGPVPERVQPEYAITAIFSSLTSEDVKKRQSYYLCEYQLTDLHTGRLLWSDKYEVKKAAVKGFLD
jgi:PBP1b-binding outer membrane lipoprotein LpoB